MQADPIAPAPAQPTRELGRMRPWFAFGLVLAALGVLAFGLHALSRRVEASHFARVEPGRVRLEAQAGWADPRWEEEIAWSLAALPPFAIEDEPARAQLGVQLASLSFVAAVGEIEPLWPDGLRLDLRLRRPVACVQMGHAFVALDAEGVVLSGRWPLPPRVGSGYLPVLWCPEKETAGLSPGARVDGQALLDGLAVASGLSRHLDPAALDTLGRIAIDARRARAATVEEPGVRLLLEHARLVLFGRSPLSAEPGELPLEFKWSALADGLALLRSGDPQRDWDLLDLRFDTPRWRPRGAQEMQPGQPGPQAGSRVERAEPASGARRDANSSVR
jgi:hypothetical protein